MGDSAILPVIVGLGAGIALIVIFASAPNPLHLTIEGMKESYRVNEPITFTLRVSGYGQYCQSPNAAIWNASSSFASVPLWRSGLPSVLCPPYQQPHFVDDRYSWRQDRSAVIDKSGEYIFGANVGSEPTVQKEFAVH